MAILAICPFCSKTIAIERVPKLSCPDCGNSFGYGELQRKHLLIDTNTAATELAAATDFFKNGEYLSAREHFSRALDANQNSYQAKYFVMLCDIYLHEAADGDKSYDAMSAVVDMIDSSLTTLSRANAAVADKLTFITAMLAETKIIITRRLMGRDELFQNDINKFRKLSIYDLEKLLDLFKIDRELIMSFAPEVSAALAEIADCAVKVCYKAVQTVAIGEELYAPDDDVYKKLLALCNELCFFGHSFDASFDAQNYSPDFTQNYMLNEKVLSRLAKFDESNKLNAKKNIIGDSYRMEAYDSILAECAKALKFTYLNCYRSMCSRQVKQHAQLFFNGFDMLYRLLTPRVMQNDKKHIEVKIDKFVDIVERCDMLTRFLVDAYEVDPAVTDALAAYYAKLYAIVNDYLLPEMKLPKNNGDAAAVTAFRNTAYNIACCCAPALRKYVDFSAEADKSRAKLVKICKEATEAFLLHSGLSIDEIEQSNFYRPILQISTAILDEDNE